MAEPTIADVLAELRALRTDVNTLQFDMATMKDKSASASDTRLRYWSLVTPLDPAESSRCRTAIVFGAFDPTSRDKQLAAARNGINASTNINFQKNNKFRSGDFMAKSLS